MFRRGDGKIPNPCPLAAFDFDGTLIYSSVGRSMAVKSDMGIDAYPGSVIQLQRLKAAGWMIVIFSNRRGPPWEQKATAQRINNWLQRAKLPNAWAFLATKSDNYRKPGTGMLTLFTQLAGVKTLDPGSFYCGDASGPSSKDPWLRWSASDREFAVATRLKFYEPAELLGFWSQDFLLSSPLRKEGKSVLLTLGAQGSGWEAWNHLDGQLISYGEVNLFVTTTLLPLPEGSSHQSKKKHVVPLVLGSNHERAGRDRIREYYGAKTSLILWFGRPPLIGSDYAYERVQLPGPDEPFHRMN